MKDKPIPIKSCPFCGGKPDVFIARFNKWGRDFVSAHVECLCKGQAGYNVKSYSSEDKDAVIDFIAKQAIDTWNKRTGGRK